MTDQLGQWVLRVLAIAGAAAVVGFGAGLVTQGLSRLLTTRPIPRIPLNIIRVLGAVVGGWIAFYLVFGHGPGGFGGGGGWALFGGPGGGSGGTGKAPPPAGETGRGEAAPRETGKATGEGITLDVEVLPRRDAYRVQTPDGSSQEMNFHDLTEYLLKQKKATPPVTALQVSPGQSDPSAPAVTRIIDWAGNNGLKAVTPPRPAP